MSVFIYTLVEKLNLIGWWESGGGKLSRFVQFFL